MRRLNLRELITSDLIETKDYKDYEWLPKEKARELNIQNVTADLLFIYRTREGSAEKHSDELLAELLAEAIVTIRSENVHPDLFK